MQDFYVERGVLTRPCQSKPGQITLPYRRYYRSGNNRLTVFFLGGGPGVSHLSFKPPQAWLDLVDVIVLEYRGVGQSSLVLSSPYFTRALRKPITALNLKGSTKLGESVAQGFKHLQQQGIAFEDFGLNPMADDVEALRQQLGLGKIILIAHSFGTRVAQVIQTRYRSSVQGALLLGNNTPPYGLIWFPEHTQAVWKRWCQSTIAKESGLGKQVEEKLLSGWTRPNWSSGDSKALFMTFFMMFSQTGQQRAFNILLAAQKGFSLHWWLLGKAFPLFAPFILNWSTFFVKGYVIDGHLPTVLANEIKSQNTIFQNLSGMLFSGLEAFYQLGGKQEEQLEIDYRNTLLVTGEFDPTTPIERWPIDIPAEHRIILPNASHAEPLSIAINAGANWIRQLIALPEIEG